MDENTKLFFEKIIKCVFPRGERDIALSANKLLWITNHSMSYEKAQTIILRVVALSVITDFTKERLITHLKPYAIEHFTPVQIDEFYTEVLSLKKRFLDNSSELQNENKPIRKKWNLQLSDALIQIIVPIFALGAIFFIVSVLDDYDNESKTLENPVQEELLLYWNEQAPEELPKTGTFWKEYHKPILAPLQIVTNSTDNYLIKLKTFPDGDDYLRIFIRGGETIDILVPLGKYEMVYAVGDVWYGIEARDEYYFGADTSFYKADEVFEFFETSSGYMGHTVELYLQHDGNLSTSSIGAHEF